MANDHGELKRFINIISKFLLLRLFFLKLTLRNISFYNYYLKCGFNNYIEILEGKQILSKKTRNS